MAYEENGKLVINAMMGGDLVTFLKGQKLYEKFAKGEGSCHFCYGDMDVRSISAIVGVPHGFAFVCEKWDCYRSALDHGSSTERI